MIEFSLDKKNPDVISKILTVKTLNKVTEQTLNKMTEKILNKMTDKTLNKMTEKTLNKAAEKTLNKMTEKTSDKVAEKIPKNRSPIMRFHCMFALHLTNCVKLVKVLMIWM